MVPMVTYMLMKLGFLGSSQGFQADHQAPLPHRNIFVVSTDWNTLILTLWRSNHQHLWQLSPSTCEDNNNKKVFQKIYHKLQERKSGIHKTCVIWFSFFFFFASNFKHCPLASSTHVIFKSESNQKQGRTLACSREAGYETSSLFQRRMWMLQKIDRYGESSQLTRKSLVLEWIGIEISRTWSDWINAVWPGNSFNRKLSFKNKQDPTKNTPHTHTHNPGQTSYLEFRLYYKFLNWPHSFFTSFPNIILPDALLFSSSALSLRLFIQLSSILSFW